jgi:hypothetical protein
MSYHITNRFAGFGADPGCVAVPTILPNGNSYTAQLCPSGSDCGSGAGISQALKDLGYQCDGTDCRPALFAFRAARGLPTETRGDILPETDCPALYQAWIEWSAAASAAGPPAPTPLPGTGIRKMLSTLSARRPVTTGSSATTGAIFKKPAGGQPGTQTPDAPRCASGEYWNAAQGKCVMQDEACRGTYDEEGQCVVAKQPPVTEPVVGFWEARSTVEKGLIIAGGVAVVGAIGFAFTR